MARTTSVLDADLLVIKRDLESKGIPAKSWRIANEIKARFNIDMDHSTVRGRFIEMGIPLSNKVSTPVAQQIEAEAPIEVEEHLVRKHDSELGEYIPQDEEFSFYLERAIDKRLSVHYDIGPKVGRYKYPITQGKQGTGKTFSHSFYAWKKQLPFFLFSCYEDFKLQKLFGDKTIVNGTVKFQESLFVKAIQEPSVILFDEVNAVSNQNSFDFHALLQNRELFIKDANDGQGKTYRLHPECRIGFAQNPKSAKYIGGNIKPSNFLGRCTFITYPEFEEADMKNELKKKFDKVKASDLNKFIKFYFACVKLIEQGCLPLDISIRQLTNMIDLWSHGLTIKEAIEDGLICMVDAVSQPKAKEALEKLSHGVWAELMPVELKPVSPEINTATEMEAKLQSYKIALNNAGVQI